MVTEIFECFKDLSSLLPSSLLRMCIIATLLLSNHRCLPHHGFGASNSSCSPEFYQLLTCLLIGKIPLLSSLSACTQSSICLCWSFPSTTGICQCVPLHLMQLAPLLVPRTRTTRRALYALDPSAERPTMHPYMLQDLVIPCSYVSEMPILLNSGHHRH